MNVTSYSIGKPNFNPTVGGVEESATALHKGGPSTIVVMMNGNSNAIQSSFINEVNKLPSHLMSNRIQANLNSRHLLQQNNTQSENCTMPGSSTNMSFYETGSKTLSR